MNIRERIRRFLLGVVQFFVAIYIIISPVDGYEFIKFVLAIGLLIAGARSLIYYFTMGRFSVGGKVTLLVGIIVLDFAAFTLSLSQVPRAYVLVYLLVLFLFTGVVDVLRGLEAKKYDMPGWEFNFVVGLINLIIALSCIFFVRSIQLLVVAYGFGLIVVALGNIASAFRRTAIVYIQ